MLRTLGSGLVAAALLMMGGAWGVETARAANAAAAAGAAAPPASEEGRGTQVEVMPLVDHHMHIFSPEASRVLGMICKVLGPEGCPPQVSHEPTTGADAIAALDKAGIGKGVLLSTAYVFGSPELAGERIDVAKGMREENTYIVAQAAASCGRLVAFIGVAPLAPGAVEEVEYWGRKGGAVGVKLHLGSSRFDFRDPQQVRALARIFQAAGRWHLAIVMHMQTRLKDYGATDARIFLKEVFPRAAGVTVQIAHAAGGGGVNSGELAALETFAQAIQDHPRETRGLYFDLAMVPDLFANEGKIAASAADVAGLEKLMMRIGLGRFLLASDYTPGLDLRAYFDNQRAALGLSAKDWGRLVGNVAPYIRSAPVGADCHD